MKKLMMITLVMMTGISMSIVPARAGSRHRHLMEGIIIGTGCAVLGAAILNEIKDDGRSCSKKYRHHEKRHHRYIAENRRAGSWRMQKVWVSPVFEKRWNPGHYNRRGRWVPGHRIKIKIRDGYWEKKRVWVSF